MWRYWVTRPWWAIQENTVKENVKWWRSNWTTGHVTIFYTNSWFFESNAFRAVFHQIYKVRKSDFTRLVQSLVAACGYLHDSHRYRALASILSAQATCKVQPVSSIEVEHKGQNKAMSVFTYVTGNKEYTAGHGMAWPSHHRLVRFLLHWNRNREGVDAFLQWFLQECIPVTKLLLEDYHGYLSSPWAFMTSSVTWGRWRVHKFICGDVYGGWSVQEHNNASGIICMTKHVSFGT